MNLYRNFLSWLICNRFLHLMYRVSVFCFHRMCLCCLDWHRPHFLYHHFIPRMPPLPSMATAAACPHPRLRPSPTVFSIDGRTKLPNPAANAAMFLCVHFLLFLLLTILLLHNYFRGFHKNVIFEVLNISVYSIPNYCTVPIFSFSDVLNVTNGNCVGSSLWKKSIIFSYTC